MINPALVIVAMLLLLDDQVPLLFGVTFAVEPVQTDEGPLITGAPGTALIITSLDEGELQLFEFITLNE